MPLMTSEMPDRGFNFNVKNWEILTHFLAGGVEERKCRHSIVSHECLLISNSGYKHPKHRSFNMS